MTSVDDSSLAAIFPASVAASSRMMSVTRLSPRICGTAKRPSTASGASASASCWVRHGVDSSGRVTLTSLSGLSVGFDAGDVDGLNLADVGQDGVELAGEAVQLVVGQRQPGQPGQVGHLVAGDLGHDRKA